MRRARYGFWRLGLLGELAGMAQRRVEAAMATTQENACRNSPDARGRSAAIRRVLLTALRRKAAQLHSAFPETRALPMPAEQAEVACLIKALLQAGRVQQAMLDDLADDGELDVVRIDAYGRARVTQELLAELILLDAELAGRAAALGSG